MKWGKLVFVFLLVLFAVLIAGGAVLGYTLALTQRIKDNEHFVSFRQALPTRVFDVRGDLITEFSSDERREIVKFDDLPPVILHAVLAREDRTFYSHRGYNLKAILRAAYGVLLRKNLGGGSTITQQIAGLLYTDRSDKSIRRKVVELWWALQMERRYSKDEILELYLNKVYLGGGVYGVNAASRFYFGHPVTEITAAEAAILVIQLSSPALYNPFEHPNVARDRQLKVLTDMVDLGYISEDEKMQSFESYWTSFDYTRTASSSFYNREDKARWFSEYVRRELQSMMYGTMDLYSDGYVVHTTCDLRHQAAAEETVKTYIEIANKRVEKSSQRHFTQGELYSNVTELLAFTFNLSGLHTGPERLKVKSMAHYIDEINPIVDMMALTCGIENLKMAANRGTAQMRERQIRSTVEGTLVTLENETGHITALVGGSKFDQSNQLIRAVQGTLQPGSSFKPLVYSAAIDTRKITPATVIHDTPQVFYTETGVPYIPTNYRGEWLGDVLVSRALAKSCNVPAVKVLETIGFDAAINRAAALLGITDPAVIEREFPRVYPLVLGIARVSPLQMCKAFATFANQGREVNPIAILTIENRDGLIVFDPEKDLREQQRKKGDAIQIVTPANAYVMTQMLQETVRIGTLRNPTNYGKKFTYKDPETGKFFKMPMAGKTGTTQNWGDAWTLGFSPYYTTAIWFGYDRGNKSLGFDNTGSTLAGYAWGNYMKEIHEGMPFKDFTRPEKGTVFATVCEHSGKLPTDVCTDGTLTLCFLAGTAPVEYCEYHKKDILLQNLAGKRLQQAALSVGQGPVDFDIKELTIDPAIFVDPEPETAPTDKNKKTPVTPLDKPASENPLPNTTGTNSGTTTETPDTTTDDEENANPLLD